MCLGKVVVPSLVALVFACVGQAQHNPARTKLIFPIYVVSKPSIGLTFWGTSFRVLNPNDVLAEVRFSLFDSAGSLKRSTRLVVHPFQTSGTGLFDYEVLREDVVGWVRVDATQPVVVQQTISRACCPVPIGLTILTVRSSIVLTAPLPTRSDVVSVFNYPTLNSDTGITVVYPAAASAAPVNIALTFRWVDGRLVSRKTLTLPPNGQLVRYFNELFPEVPGLFPNAYQYGGTIELRFDQDVYMTAIQTQFIREIEQMQPAIAGTTP